MKADNDVPVTEDGGKVHKLPPQRPTLKRAVARMKRRVAEREHHADELRATCLRLRGLLWVADHLAESLNDKYQAAERDEALVVILAVAKETTEKACDLSDEVQSACGGEQFIALADEVMS